MNDKVVDSFFSGAEQNHGQKCGYVALTGRPNVGKSTLLNLMVGLPLSIVSHKPQTTRHRIAGIQNTDKGQVIFIDMPGIHLAEKNQAINRYMNRIATASLQDADIVVMLVEAGVWTDEDSLVLKRLEQVNSPVFCAINKIDRLEEKDALLPEVERIQNRYPFDQMFMISALKNKGIEAFEKALYDQLPFSKPFYDEDQLTDRSERFLAAEFIREQLTTRLHKEIPYQLTVEIETWQHEKDLLRVGAVIWIQRDSQKKIVIGKKGEVLKQVGQSARLRLEALLEQKVFLQLWVKVKQGWADDEKALRNLGYDD